MGCACFKSDVVIKSNKNLMHLSSNNFAQSYENNSRRGQNLENFQNRNSQRNQVNENNYNNNNNINYFSNLNSNNPRHQSIHSRINQNDNSSNQNNQSKFFYYLGISSIRNIQLYNEFLNPHQDDYQPHLQMNDVPNFNMPQISKICFYF